MDTRKVSDEVVKITQSLGLLLSLDENRRMDKLKLVKLVWAADRYHLRKYGRTVTNTEYFALPLGPVSSQTLDVINGNEIALYPEDIAYITEHITLWDNDKKQVVLYNDMPSDHLSETDQEALRFAWDRLGGEDSLTLANDITHLYPEWSKFRDHFDVKNERSSKKIDLNDFFKNPDNDKFFGESDELLSASKEIYEQSKATSDLLG